MPEPLRIPIRPDWDTTLTYDSLYEDPVQRPVFVGRETLIAPLVAEIAEPNKRGTYLISGYRGTGKTTLLIEALTRAKRQLAINDYTLFPIVLNVSEVSASLGQTADNTPLALNIDPRRLLIALIRQMRDGISRLALQTAAMDELTATVNDTYEKATAAKFSVSASGSQEQSRTRSRELALTLDDKNLLRTLGVMAGAGAVAFEAAAWIPRFGLLHAAAVGLGTLSAVGLAASYKRTRSEKWTNTRQTALEHDNSLQQLETDLKDILAALKKHKLRTVVVLEELDKIDDPKGLQLASVIRYFKNLFTQAPALFFFVTDKSYFDIVASAIKRARRDRSYAVEHTFFTHRIFVGRPTTEECLRFITALADNNTDRTAIAKVADTLGKPGLTAKTDQLGRFIRLVLFAAANHMFDLKNELRLFARNEEKQVNGATVRTTSFLVDDTTLPAEQQALAVFQDLIVEKSRSFEIKGGRAYANETLVDSLYAVFNELGSTQPQEIDSFLPSTNSEANDGLLLDEQLDLSEAARVRQAVLSLIGDLERGEALQPREPTANAFTWREDPARQFRYVRQLQQHEEQLIAELQRTAALANALIIKDPPESHPLANKLDARVLELREAHGPLTVDQAAEEQRTELNAYRDALLNVFNARMTELQKYGFTFELLAPGLGGWLYLVKPQSGDPRLSTSSPRGAVLLAFGDSETLDNDVWSFVMPTAPSLATPNRLALVHIIHATGNIAAEVEIRRGRWLESLGKRAQGPSHFLSKVEVLPLNTPRTDPTSVMEPDDIQKAAALLAELGAWARPEMRVYEPLPMNTPPLSESLNIWKSSTHSVLHINGAASLGARGFGERHELETYGTTVLGLGEITKSSDIFADTAMACMLKGFEQGTGPREQWAPLGKWLFGTGRIILYVDWEGMFSWTAEDLLQVLKTGARMIITKSGELPPEFSEFGIRIVPVPATERPAQ